MDPHPLNIYSTFFFLLQCKTRLDTNTSVLSCPPQQKDNYTIIIEIQKKEEKRKYGKADTKKNKLGGPPTHKHLSSKLSFTAKWCFCLFMQH